MNCPAEHADHQTAGGNSSAPSPWPNWPSPCELNWSHCPRQRLGGNEVNESMISNLAPAIVLSMTHSLPPSPKRPVTERQITVGDLVKKLLSKKRKWPNVS